MNARWQAYCDKFAALKPREQWLVVGAVLFGIGMVGYTLGVEPAILKTRTLQKQLEQGRAEIAKLEPQAAALKSQLRDPDALNRTALAETKEKLAALERELRDYDGILVPPGRMSQLLQSLLARHRGVELLSVQNLPATPLLAPKAEAEPAKPTDAAAPKPAAARGGNIFKHGIELRLAGSYPDLLAYLAELERSPQKLLWGQMELSVQAYPRSELRLTLYTLSLDTTWLVV